MKSTSKHIMIKAIKTYCRVMMVFVMITFFWVVCVQDSTAIFKAYKFAGLGCIQVTIDQYRKETEV